MPQNGSFLEFHDGQNQFKVPFFMYADFEAILKPANYIESDPENSFTKEINQHILWFLCA